MIDPTKPDFTNTPVSPQRPCFSYSLADVSTPPSVTIITPFYNMGSIFEETARSVFRQSFQQWEWLIINDSSTDPESLSILEDYRHKDPRIRVIDHEGNKGLSAARNTGFRAARSQYVVQLDSDDLLEPTAVDKWCWCLESYPEFAFVKGYSVGFGAQEYLWDKGFHSGRAFLDENLVDATSMLRKGVHEAVGGYDETIRDGLEDWDFWLRCASFGYWGGTVPEYLNWYRRRSAHGDRWANLNTEQQQAYRMQLRQRYPRLWDGGFPQIQLRSHMPNDIVPDELPCENHLHKTKPRLLMIVPWLAMGGSDKFTLDLLQQLIGQRWEVAIATTLTGDHRWLPQFARSTPDIFILDHFLRLVDYPRFLRYLIQSRQVDVVMVSHSEMGYLLLPYLRAHCPGVTFVDFCHIEEREWKNGGYPRLAVEYQESLDLNIVSSEHLKRWMVQRGAEPDRIGICTDFRPEQMGRRVLDLFEQAIDFHNRHPRPQASLDLGRACATQVVEESVLLSHIAEWLWSAQEQTIREQQAGIRELEQAKAWLEEQRDNWQRLAQERELMIQEQQAWIRELEQAKAWLEEQQDKQQAWIAELEKAKAWWEGQSAHWQRLAEQREQIIQEQQAIQTSIWVRLGLRLGILKPPK